MDECWSRFFTSEEWDDFVHAMRNVDMTDKAERLMLAAPVLIEALRVSVSNDCPPDITPFNLLVGWLSGEPGCPEVDIDGFLQWLRTGEGKVLR